MSYPGNGLLLRLPFIDNKVLSNRRTFLSIEEEGGYIHLLNVSSLQGKEHKLLLPSNEEILKYSPPFKVRSMIKFDALFKVEHCSELNRCVLHRGQPLDSDEFQRIIDLYKQYSIENQIAESVTSASELKSYLSR